MGLQSKPTNLLPLIKCHFMTVVSIVFSTSGQKSLVGLETRFLHRILSTLQEKNLVSKLARDLRRTVLK